VTVPDGLQAIASLEPLSCSRTPVGPVSAAQTRTGVCATVATATLSPGLASGPESGTDGYAEYSRVLAGDMRSAGAFHKAHWRALRGGLQVAAHAAPLMMTTTTTTSARLHEVQNMRRTLVRAHIGEYIARLLSPEIR
jgi:hypothetical protein